MQSYEQDESGRAGLRLYLGNPHLLLQALRPRRGGGGGLLPQLLHEPVFQECVGIPDRRGFVLQHVVLRSGLHALHHAILQPAAGEVGKLSQVGFVPRVEYQTGGHFCQAGACQRVSRQPELFFRLHLPPQSHEIQVRGAVEFL